MHSSSSNLVTMLRNKRVFLSEDIPALNELLAEARADEIPSDFRSDIVDIIDMMFMCGNVNLESRSRIDALYNHLARD